MIHTVWVTPETEIAELKKAMRKSLMTGGAVIRLQDADSETLLETLCQKFAPSAVEHSVESLVLREIAKSPFKTAQIQERLLTSGIPSVVRECHRESEVPAEHG